MWGGVPVPGVFSRAAALARPHARAGRGMEPDAAQAAIAQMERPVTVFLVILAAAILLEVAYHFATVGGLTGGDSHYPTPHEIAREAGLLPKPSPLMPRVPPTLLVPEAPSSAPPVTASQVAARPAAIAPRRLKHLTRPPAPSETVAYPPS